MKKVINILVSIIFLISFIGVNIYKHYSQGKLYSIAIFQEAESCCENRDTCEMADMKKGCHHQQIDDCSCEDQIETFQITDYFVKEEFRLSTKKVVDLYFASLFQTIGKATLFTSYNNANLFPSPPLNKTDVQSEFGVFII